MMTIMTRINVAEAKKRFSDLLGRVAYGGETVVITRRGKPMARLVPMTEQSEASEIAQPTVPYDAAYRRRKIAEREPDEAITAALDEVYSDTSSELDPVLARIQATSLADDDGW